MPQFSSLAGELLTIELGTSDSTDLFTTQRRQNAILAGEREFADLTDCLIIESTITCSNGVREYNLLSTAILEGSSQFSRLSTKQMPEYRLVSSGGGSTASTTHVAGIDFPRRNLERLNWEEPGWRQSTGSPNPDGWYLRDDGGQRFFGFKTPPTIRSSERGYLTVPYVPLLSQSTASTSEPFTVSSQVRTDLRPYHQALVHYAASRLEPLRKDHDAAIRQLAQFLGYVTRFLTTVRPKQGRVVRLARHYFREAGRGRPHDRMLLDPRRY